MGLGEYSMTPFTSGHAGLIIDGNYRRGALQVPANRRTTTCKCIEKLLGQ